METQLRDEYHFATLDQVAELLEANRGRDVSVYIESGGLVALFGGTLWFEHSTVDGEDEQLAIVCAQGVIEGAGSVTISAALFLSASTDINATELTIRTREGNVRVEVETPFDGLA